MFRKRLFFCLIGLLGLLSSVPGFLLGAMMERTAKSPRDDGVAVGLGLLVSVVGMIAFQLLVRLMPLSFWYRPPPPPESKLVGIPVGPRNPRPLVAHAKP